jgi:hypothetical protein
MKYFFFRMLPVCFSLAILFAGHSSVLADILHVPHRYKTIQEAVRNAVEGDTILVAPGTYHFYFDNLTIIHEVLTLKSNQGAGQTIIVGKSGRPVITLAGKSRALIEGFTIKSEYIDQRISRNGGAIYCEPGTAPVIKNNTIVDNVSIFGGAIYCDTQSSPIISNNIIKGNKALVAGGGIYSVRSTATIRRNFLLENEAKNSGGAIGCNRDASSLNNNIIWNNRARFGGGISCDRAASIIGNNTLVANQAEYGGGIMVDRGSVRLTNLILWQNTTGDLYMKETGPSARPSYSDIQDGSFRGMNNNISVDPLFVDQDQGDFRLQEGSPCKKTGVFDPFYMDERKDWNDIGAYGGSDAPVEELSSDK